VICYCHLLVLTPFPLFLLLAVVALVDSFLFFLIIAFNIYTHTRTHIRCVNGGVQRYQLGMTGLALWLLDITGRLFHCV
jgi:hypothetical protein